MKTILLATALTATLVANPSHASVTAQFECGVARSIPAETNEKNPVIKTKLLISFTASDRFTNFIVEHYAANGEVYKRAEQYRDIRLQSTKDHERWNGISIANPKLTMVGTLFEARVKGQKHTYYVERVYHNGKLSLTTTNICRGIDDDE